MAVISNTKARNAEVDGGDSGNHLATLYEPSLGEW